MNVMVSLSATPMAHPPRSNPFLRSSSDAPPFPCITPSTVTCVMVVSFMVAAPFSLGFCRRLIRPDRGADLIGRSRVRTENSTRRFLNTKRTRTASCASAREYTLSAADVFGLIFVVVVGMLLGVGLSQWRGGGHAVFASRAARVVFGQEYGPSWFRTTRWPHFDYGMRIICGTGFILVGLLAIVSVIFRL